MHMNMDFGINLVYAYAYKDTALPLYIEKALSLKIKVKTPVGKNPDIYKNADEDLLSASSSAFFVSIFNYSKENC